MDRDGLHSLGLITLLKADPMSAQSNEWKPITIQSVLIAYQ